MTSPFELAPYLAQQQERVERLLEGAAARWTAPPALAEAMRYSLLGGGKRLRPILCLAVADAVSRRGSGGGRVADDAACAVEMIHTYSLIHDDLPAMDDDDLRRGRPTSHKRFGEAMAILAGDALLTDAFTLLAEGDEPVRLRLCAELARGAGSSGMVGGQVLDIAEDRPAELAYVLRLHRLKTGALITAACRMGALAGGGSPDEVAAAGAYGEAVGLAFQIHDDVLDVTGSPEALGKPARADAAAGRFTFPALVGLDRARALAFEQVQRAQEAVAHLEARAAPLVALARYAVERTS
jgi:geranylgeranyl diphosphate synthase, type II